MNRDLGFVALALMTWGVGEGMFYFFQPLYLQQLGADPVQIGSIIGLVGLAMTISYLPAGMLSDRIGRVPLLRLAWILGILSTLLLAFGGSLTVFVAGMVIYGTTAFVTVPLNSYTTAARGRLSVGRTITLISAAFNFGAVAGPLLGGWLGERFGLQTNFRLALILFVISTVFIFLIRPQPVVSVTADNHEGGIGALLNRRFLGFIVLLFFAMFSMYLPQPLVGNFLQNERGVGLAVIGTLLSIRSLGVVIMNLVLGQVNPRVGFASGQIGVALFSLLIWMGSGLPIYLAAYFFMGSYMTARNLTFAQVRTLAHSGNMGAAYGIIETVNALTLVCGPPLAGLLYKIQPEIVYPISIGLIAISLAAYLVLSPVRRRDLQAFEKKELEASKIDLK